MSWRWLHSVEEFTPLRPAWDAALASTVTPAGGANPFLLSDFIVTWASRFVPAGRLRLLVFFQGEALVGGLPLYAATRRGIPVLNPVGLGFANRNEGFALTTVPLDAALAALPGWQYLNLPLVRLKTAENWLGTPELPRLVSFAGLNASIRVAEPAAAYLARLRPKMQANLRACLRKAAAVGAVSLERVADPEAVAALARRHLEFSQVLRYRHAAASAFPQPAWEAFTEEVCVAFARAGRLDAMVLRIGDTVAALGFGFRLGPGYNSVLASYNPHCRAMGPGFLFFYELVEWCFRQGEPVLDMYADGRDFDKRRWCNTFSPLATVRIFHPGPAARLLYNACRLRQLWQPSSNAPPARWPIADPVAA